MRWKPVPRPDVRRSGIDQPGSAMPKYLAICLSRASALPATAMLVRQGRRPGARRSRMARRTGLVHEDPEFPQQTGSSG